MAVPKKRPRARADLLLSSSKHFRPYVTAIGQAALQWNLLHEALAVLFMVIIKGDHVGQYLGIWAAVSSDRSKRDMLKAAIADVWVHPDAREERARLDIAKAKIKDLLGAIDGLEEVRNNVVHAPLQFERNALRDDFGSVSPFTFLSNARARKLESRHLMSEYRWCRDYALILGRFALDISDCISERTTTWPETPRPPNRGQKTTPPANPRRRISRPTLPRRASKELCPN